MEITGKIIAVLTAKNGVSKSTGNPWMVQEFVLETAGQYPRRCVFNVFGEEKSKELNIQIGQTITAYIDIDAHEWEGKWFNTIKAYRIDHGQEAATTEPPKEEAASKTTATQEVVPETPTTQEGDLPF